MAPTSSIIPLFELILKEKYETIMSRFDQQDILLQKLIDINVNKDKEIKLLKEQLENSRKDKEIKSLQEQLENSQKDTHSIKIDAKEQKEIMIPKPRIFSVGRWKPKLRKNIHVALTTLDKSKQLNPESLYDFLCKAAIAGVEKFIQNHFKDGAPNWNELEAHHKKRFMTLFNQKVLNRFNIDLTLCEDYWITEHILKTSYQIKIRSVDRKR